MAHSPSSLDLTPCDYWMFACVKEHMRTKRFETEDSINIAITVSNLVQQWHWEAMAHSPYSLDLTPCDYWLFACVKEHLWTEQFESEDGINIAVTVSLHHPCKNEYTVTAYHMDGKSVWTVLVSPH